MVPGRGKRNRRPRICQHAGQHIGCLDETISHPALPFRPCGNRGLCPVQRVWLQSQVFADLRVPAAAEDAVSSLDPRAKRFRAADRSLQQARHALEGARLALADLPRSGLSPVTSALDEIQQALSNIAAAGAQIDEARIESDDTL